MTATPLVTIAIPTLNRCPLLERSIKAVLTQTYAHLELIIVDGKSTDGTLEMVHKLQQRECRLYYTSTSCDEPTARNIALREAQGEIIGFISDDDYYYPTAVSQAVDFLYSHPELHGVAGGCQYIDSHGRYVPAGVATYKHIEKVNRDNLLFHLALRGNSGLAATTTFFTRPTPLRYRSHYNRIPDIDYYARYIMEGFRIGRLDSTMAAYTIHSSQGAIASRKQVLDQTKLLHQELGFTPLHKLIFHFLSPIHYALTNPYMNIPHYSYFLLKGGRRL